MLAIFCDPHPGLSGCPHPLPEKVRQFAAIMSGVEADLESVKSVILSLAKANDDDRYCDYAIMVSKDVINSKDCIILSRIFATGRIDAWRVLRFCHSESSSQCK